MTQNLILQTKKRPHNVKSVKTLGFYYKLRVGDKRSGIQRSSALFKLKGGKLEL